MIPKSMLWSMIDDSKKSRPALMTHNPANRQTVMVIKMLVIFLQHGLECALFWGDLHR
jgi:hypothetical protein